MTVLGNLTINGKGTHIYESIDSFSEAIEIPNIKILRFGWKGDFGAEVLSGTH